MRKPYVSAQPANWYMKKEFYKRYMLRELTCVPIALYVLNLMAGVVALAGSLLQWQAWVQMQKNPFMLLLVLLCLIASVFHSATWFQTTPKVMKVQQGERFLPERYILAAHWLVFFILALVFFLITVACV